MATRTMSTRTVATKTAGPRESAPALEVRLAMYRTMVECRRFEVRAQELRMASSLIDSMTVDFDPDEYHDRYREAVARPL